jgi:photosystem II stability/assembly factor-like uncharacterized protein
MTRAVVVFAVVGLASAALARDGATVRRQLAFARLQSPSFGVAVVYDLVRCGAYCKSYKPHVYAVDYGRSWREVTPPHVLEEPEDVVFLSRRVGWISANDCAAGKAFVYATTDGGRIWRRAPIQATNCAAGSRHELAFSDARHGWSLLIFENGNESPLEHTTDGGKTWRQVTPNAPLKGRIAFATARDGWLAQTDFASPRQQLYVTHDGGRSWRRRRVATPSNWRGAKVFPYAPTFFGTRGVLPVALVRGRRTAIAFYTTRNRGRTWRPRAVRRVTFPVLAPRAGPFVRYLPTSIASASVWWIAGREKHPFVAVTTDAGASWHVSTPPDAVSEISAADGRHAWLTTSRRTTALYTTSDGGRTWHRLEPPMP